MDGQFDERTTLYVRDLAIATAQVAARAVEIQISGGTADDVAAMRQAATAEMETRAHAYLKGE